MVNVNNSTFRVCFLYEKHESHSIIILFSLVSLCFREMREISTLPAFKQARFSRRFWNTWAGTPWLPTRCRRRRRETWLASGTSWASGIRPGASHVCIWAEPRRDWSLFRLSMGSSGRKTPELLNHSHTYKKKKRNFEILREPTETLNMSSNQYAPNPWNTTRQSVYYTCTPIGRRSFSY